MDKVLTIILSLIGNERGAKSKFSQTLGLPSSALGDWQTGRNKSYLKKLPEIAAYFDVSVDYLLGNTDTKKEPAPNQEGEFSEKDIRLLNWFRSLPQEKQKAILVAQDAPKDLL